MSEFKPGFRLSKRDILTLLIGCFAAFYFYTNSDRLLSLIILFVVGHFFLFCNVIRMSRIPELIWAIFFLSTMTCSEHFQFFHADKAFYLSLLITSILVYFESRKPDYHGVFWEKLNPNLPEWFRNRNLQK